MNTTKGTSVAVVLLMLLSTFTLINNVFVAFVQAQPGVDVYGNATIDIVYGQSYANNEIKINSSQFQTTVGGSPYGENVFRLFYPVYQNYSNNAWSMTWKMFYVSGSPVEIDQLNDLATLDTGGSPITFNRSGIWIFDNNAIHTSDDPTSFSGYIWVNTSTVYAISGASDIYYGQTGSMTLTVNTLGDGGCMVAIVNPNNQTIYHSWRSTGQTGELDYEDYFTTIGTYTIKAYRDLDTSVAYRYQDQNGDNYSATYGSNGDFPANYSYADMGPWNPPEKNATQVKLKVKTASNPPYLNIRLTNNSFYWGYPIHIDVNVTNSTGAGLIGTINVRKNHLYLDGSEGAFTITDEGLGNYTITMPWRGDNPTPWTTLTTLCDAAGVAVNGTWNVVFRAGNNYNGSKTFTIGSNHPPVQLLINTPSDKKVDVPAYTPDSGENGTTTIDFSIFGNNDQWPYYGFDAVKDDANNITISGDILYPVKARPGVGNGRWTATVTPTKPGGTITIAIDWPGNGTASQTINIINGTSVTTSTDRFTVGADYNLTVTVKDCDGDPVKNAVVYLMWQDIHTQFNVTVGDNTVGNGKNGEYTFWIRMNDASTPTTAPQNITIAALWGSSYWGYAKVIMDRNHDLTVNCTPTVSLAGNETIYDIYIGRTSGGHPSTSGLNVALYNKTGALVTGVDAWSATGEYQITDEMIILSGGIFQFFTYNDTHDSTGHNATLTVAKYQVNSTPHDLTWLYDNNTDIMIQVTPAYNGILTLHNVTSEPSGADQNETSPLTIEITNGIGTVTGFNANMIGNITYSFAPLDGEDRPANGLTKVTIPIFNATPKYVHIGEPATIIVYVTKSDGTPLEEITITVQIPGYSGNGTYTSNEQGVIVFSFFPVITGDITMTYMDIPIESVVHITSGLPPVAAFSWMTDGYTAQFWSSSYDADGTIDSYEWDFGDGTYSILADPVHEYTHRGTYQVSLLVTDNTCDTDTASHQVTVSISPVSDFDYNPADPTEGNPVEFNDLSYDPDGYLTSWFWSFGDGYYSDIQNPIHTYQTNGTYFVSLFVVDNDDFLTGQSQDIIIAPNSPPATPSGPTPVDYAIDVSLTNDLSWNGDDPDGDQVLFDVYFGATSTPPLVSSQQNIAVYDPGLLAYNTTYYWKIVASDDHGHSTTGPLWQFTTISNLPPSAPSINGQSEGKKGQTYSYSIIAEDPEEQDIWYEIDWGDGTVDDWYGPVASNTIIVRNHTWAEKGTYLIKARAKDIYNALSGWGTLSVTMPSPTPIPQSQPTVPGVSQKPYSLCQSK